MEQHNYNKQHILKDLVFEYEAMSQKGTVVFYEEAVFSSIINYYFEKKNYERALSVVETALVQHNFSSFLYYKKAELLSIYCHRDPKILDDAFIAVEKAGSLSPTDSSVKLLKVELLGYRGNYSEAFNLLDEVRIESTFSSNNLTLAGIYYCESLLYEQLQQYDFMYNALKEALLLNVRHEKALRKIWFCVERSHYRRRTLFFFGLVLFRSCLPLLWAF